MSASALRGMSASFAVSISFVRRLDLRLAPPVRRKLDFHPAGLTGSVQARGGLHDHTSNDGESR